MKLLNDMYDISCKPRCESYKKLSNNITLIDNFFEDFEAARNFFLSREKWGCLRCITYQNHSKPGYESFFPNWIGRSLMEKYVIDNKVSDDVSSYNAVCNHFFYDTRPIVSLSNSGCFPHYDSILDAFDAVQSICLVNLNHVPVSTKFYTFKGKEYITEETFREWEDHLEELTQDLQKSHDMNNLSLEQFKQYLDNQKNPKVRLINTQVYKPNQAIVYNGNLFHSPNVTEEFTEENPRSVLKITFNKKLMRKKVTYA